MTPKPDINVVLNELSLQIANLSRENAILKATIQALQGQQSTELITFKDEL